MSNRKNGLKTAGRDDLGQFTQGNSGRPKGAKHKTTQAVQALLDGEAEALTRKAVEKALEGDSVALRLCLERISPAPKDRPVTFPLPDDLLDIRQATEAGAGIMQAMAAGDLTPNEAAGIMAILRTYCEMNFYRDLEESLDQIEQQQKRARL
jgi:hypothetical protein